MSAPDDSDDEERTVVRPPSRARGSTVTANVVTSPSPAPEREAKASVQLGHILPVGTRLRDYEITGLIGEGGFGIVYLAWDHSLQRKVAVKEYMPASMASRVSGSSAIVVKSGRHLDTFKAGLKSFVNEARLLARFDHPSLVKVYRFWEENGTAYMVMPFYEGPTLKTALADLGHVPDENELRAWLRPLLDALSVMHGAQCYHRDIAPDNILLTPSGPLLLDFGAARRVIGDMTHALTVVLKPGYAPIEQYGDVASMTQGAWTDIYALACVVYYAITGKTPMSSVERLMDDRLEPLAVAAAGRYSPAFLNAIDAALSVRPVDRPQDERQFRALLDADLPPTPALPASPGNPISHETFAQTERHGYTTVPGTLMPVLATQVLERSPPTAEFPPTALVPPAALATAPAPLASAPVPWAQSGPASTPLPTLPGSIGDTNVATTVARLARKPVGAGTLVVAAVVLVVGLGAAWFWVQQRGDSESAVGPAPVASAAAVPQPEAASSVATPAASAATLAPLAPAASATAPATAPSAAAAPASASTTLPERVEPPAAPASSPPEASVFVPQVIPPHDTAPAASTLHRPRREPPASRNEAPANPRPAAARPSAGGRCSDILQKASLEPLTADEAAYLKRECR